MKKLHYLRVDYPHPHALRAQKILKSHPEVRELMHPYPVSFLYIAFMVFSQWGISYLMKDQDWGIIVLLSFCIGAFFNHALYVMIHECSHNLVFKSSLGNKLAGIFCDFALVLPGSMGFRNYHLLHHKHLGDYHMDADVSPEWEAKWVQNIWWRKLLWMMFFFISQGILRPIKLKRVKFWSVWPIFNFVIVMVVNWTIYNLFGPQALCYLFLSTFFALGLHPLGGRWIQEHYTPDTKQETFSYYGPLNKLTFNMGYHNEHHDLMSIPWVNLPKLKALAPEFYDSLKSYRSWTAVLWNFITNPLYSPYARVVHPTPPHILEDLGPQFEGEDVLKEYSV